MSKLNATDIQGFSLRGYNLPYARYLFARFGPPEAARAFLLKIIGQITTGQRWDNGKPASTLNVAFTHAGLRALDLPRATLLSFPLEFQEGMKARAAILGDCDLNDPANWDDVWADGNVHLWLGINGQSIAAMDVCHSSLAALMDSTGGASFVGQQDAAAIMIGGKFTTGEHFGYTDGFGNPDYLGVERCAQPGQGKLKKDGTWTPLATGELLLGYADEAGELPVAPVPHLLASNGTFMVYRKLRQNVAAFRGYIQEQARHYAGGKEKMMAKVIGRWPDGTPLELSPDREDPAIVKDGERNTNFTFGGDPEGTRCPIGAHLRRVNRGTPLGSTAGW